MKKLLTSGSIAAALFVVFITPSAHATITDNGGVQYWQSPDGYQTVTNWGTVPADAELWIGSPELPSNSTVVANGGSHFSIGTTYVGGNVASGSSLTVTGAGTLWECDGWLTVGESANASVMVSSGGTLAATSSIAIGYQSLGAAVVDGGTMTSGGIFFLNRYDGATGSSLLIQNGGKVSCANELAAWTGSTTGTVTVESGLGAFSYVNTVATATTTLNIGASGRLALGSYDDPTIANFRARFLGAGTTQLNIWNGSAYVDYTTLTEGVDYAVTTGTGDLAGKLVLQTVPEPATTALLALGACSILLIRRRRSGARS